MIGRQQSTVEPGPSFEFRAVSCAACGSGRARPVGWRGGTAHQSGLGVRTRIVRCRDCSHLYPNPMPFPALGLDDLYKETEAYFVHHDVEAKKRAMTELMRRIEGMVGRPGRLLDVGCGRGELLWAARESGWDAEGVDPSSANLRWSREHLGVEGRLGTLEDARFPGGAFDAATMGGVIEHLYEPLTTLRELNRVLKPGGLLWFDAPNEDGLFARLGNLYMRAQGRDWVVCLAPTFVPYHVQGFNPRSVRRILARAGFRVERLCVWGRIFPLTGRSTPRRAAEFQAARLLNWVGNLCGSGSYMTLWARKGGAPATDG
jgi:ubiquinone/menaquinone biosynthesis C-methylase UbiE